ncbi:phosphopantetheine-binding protein [Streptomyces sp. NPDC088124]|uniref:acyl carrier protein n=1 Tax=Streptomyces sp. NPDC088124 TaxID=3154654 RepID=UPI003416FD31
MTDTADALTQRPTENRSVEERIKKLLGEIIGDPGLADALTGESHIIEDLGLDSIQMINFLLRLEDEFDLELDYESLTFEQLGHIKELIRFVTAEADRLS